MGMLLLFVVSTSALHGLLGNRRSKCTFTSSIFQRLGCVPGQSLFHLRPPVTSTLRQHDNSHGQRTATLRVCSAHFRFLARNLTAAGDRRARLCGLRAGMLIHARKGITYEMTRFAQDLDSGGSGKTPEQKLAMSTRSRTTKAAKESRTRMKDTIGLTEAGADGGIRASAGGA
ncbi:hypothetical protein DFJ74DRAFT_695565 [Hyaloraphidium curvatum]|nr:hypothetical protein DFJ74DRAFT_695565 [Hyaloraphidium curvatum]